MKISENQTVISVTLAVIGVWAVLFVSPAASFSSGFMDLELSIKELKQLVENTAPALVTVVSYDDCGEESGRGSGFFINSKGLILTNLSVVKGAYSSEVISRSRQYENVMILQRDDSLDLALIQIKAAEETPLELGFDDKVALGERVAVIGKLHDLKKTVSEGLIVSIDDNSHLLEIETTKPLLSFRESKDGPLLNMSGKVIGIMSMSIPGMQNADDIQRLPDYQNFKAVSVSAVKEFISRPEHTEQLHPAKSKIWARWIKCWVKTAVSSTFFFLYMMGFPKMIAIAFIIFLIIFAIQRMFIKLKKNI